MPSYFSPSNVVLQYAVLCSPEAWKASEKKMQSPANQLSNKGSLSLVVFAKANIIITIAHT